MFRQEIDATATCSVSNPPVVNSIQSLNFIKYAKRDRHKFRHIAIINYLQKEFYNYLLFLLSEIYLEETEIVNNNHLKYILCV